MSSWYQEFVYFAAASETIPVQVDIKILDFVLYLLFIIFWKINC